jgi:hypothetical protein
LPAWLLCSSERGLTLVWDQDAVLGDPMLHTHSGRAGKLTALCLLWLQLHMWMGAGPELGLVDRDSMGSPSEVTLWGNLSLETGQAGPTGSGSLAVWALSSAYYLGATSAP